MTHFSHFGFHLNFVSCCLDNFMWLLNREVTDGSALLVGNLNFRKHTITNRAKHPNFITTLYEIIIAFTHEVAIYGVEQEVVKDHERIKRYAAILKHKDRDEHAIVKQMLGHRCIDEWFVFLNFKSWVGKILFHNIYDTSFGVRKEARGRHKGFEPQQQIRKFDQNKKASQFVSLLICNNTWLAT